jgi:predicted NBD/HSP70 family sugar kinase
MRPSSPARYPTDGRQQSIIRFVYGSNGVTRSEVSRATGINQSSVVRLVGELLERGLLIQEDPHVSRRRRGRPSDILRINASAAYAAGLEFGRDHLVVAITDAVGEVVSWRTETSPPPFTASEPTTRDLIAVVERSVRGAGLLWEHVDALGLALHDVVSARGEWVTNERFLDTPFPVQEHFERLTGRSTTVEDVSRAFAEAEYRFGAGAECHDMIYVFLGSHGVGSGIFVNGQLLKSSSGVCGEIGHIIVDEGGALCYCGSRGCLETVASHDAVMSQIRALLGQGVRMAMSDAENLTFGDVCRAAGSGDKAASVVLHRLAQNLSVALASVINLAGTPHVVVGGQLAQAGEVFLADLSSAIRRRVIALLARDLTVTYASLPLFAGARGVAVQALESVWMSGTVLARARARAAGTPPSRQRASRAPTTVSS